MKKVVHINPITSFLILFIVLMFFIFYYFYEIYDNVLNHDVDRDNIVSMQLLDKGVNDSTSSINQLINCDGINKDIEEFEKLFKQLKKDIIQRYPRNRELQKSLQDIDKSFKSKIESVEYFKSLNSSLISGSAFLFDLQRSITDAKDITYKTKSLINETMFYLFEFNSVKSIDKSFIEKKLEHLHSVVVVKNHRLLKNFYKQSKVLIATIAKLEKLSREILNNKLAKQLNLLHHTLDKEYKNNLYQEKVMTIFLFVVIIIIWNILLFMHIRFLKNQRLLQQAALVFANTQETIVITDSQGYIVSANRAFSDIYGYKLDEIIGKTTSIIKSGFHNELFYMDMWQQIVNNGIYQGRIINRTKDGKNIPMWITIKAVYNKSHEIINYIGVQTDLRELEASQSKAEYLAYHDALTGLYNRVSFEELSKRSVINAQRDKTEFAVLFIDLDRFKIINDTLGHDVGDKVLIRVAKRLKKILRKSDVISRWGGDEFVAILRNAPSENLVATVAKKIVEEIKKPISIDKHTLNVTTSIGIALYPKNAQDEKSLIKYADSAMYQAKNSGKNSFCFYTSTLSKEIQERLQIDLGLQNALEKNEIYLVFQPQYSLKNNKMISAEALARWESDRLGFVPPDKFIPIAEENGLIITLGYFIFEESCKKYKKMKESGVALERIAINVSTIQFRQKDLVRKFLDILHQYGLQTSEIEIEITERFFMENTENNIKILQEFREHGFTISIDDFGTGYSSMSYLKRLPIDTIKIDKSFIDDIGLGNKQDNAIVEAIIALSKKLHYTIVVEGIETKEQEEYLAKHGCDIGQGYLFSKPIKFEEMIKFYN